MKSNTVAKTALLFALSLSPLCAMAESDVKPLPFAQKPACADSETSVWCAGASDDSAALESRHPLARVTDPRGAGDYFDGSEVSR